MTTPRTFELPGPSQASVGQQGPSDWLFDVYGTRPSIVGGKWRISEPPIGHRLAPFLLISRPIDLGSTPPANVAARALAFLPTELDEYGGEPPSKIHVSKGYGLISELERIRVSFGIERDRNKAQSQLCDEIIPSLRESLGVAHCCFIRPNYRLQQLRASLPKLALLAARHGTANLQQFAVEQRFLSDVLPSPAECADWVEAFIASPPSYLSIRLAALGGHVLFFGNGMYTFPLAATHGLSHLLSSNPTMPSKDGTAHARLALKHANISIVYDHVSFACELINRICAYASNSFNFFANGSPDFRAQVQFLAGLNLLFNDMRSLTEAASDYARASFALSLLDKLANMVFARSGNRLQDREAFKALLSGRMAQHVRATAWAIGKQVSPRVGDTIVRHAKAIISTQKQIRDQNKGFHSEDQRLAWLWSYRNLRHGTFLGRQQFDALFVESKGDFPGAISLACIGLMVSLCWDPDTFFAAF